jgi:AcrR family transcriptional regulator
MPNRPPGAKKRVRRDSPEARAEFRARILAAALAIFRESGEAGITMRLVAERVGTSQMTLYGYFADRADLLRSLWNFIFAEVTDELEQAYAAKRSARTRLLALVEGWIHYWESHPDNYLLSYASNYDLMVDETKPRGTLQRPVYPRLAGFMHKVVEEFAVDAGHPISRVKLATDLMICQMLGYLHAVLTIRRYPWSDPEVLRRTVIQATVQSIEQTLSGRQ